MKNIKKTILIIVIGITLVFIGYLLGGNLRGEIFGIDFLGKNYNWGGNKMNKNNWNEDDWKGWDDDSNDDTDDSDFFDDEKLEIVSADSSISLEGIKKIFISSKVSEVRIKGVNETPELVCETKDLRPKYFSIKKSKDIIYIKEDQPTKIFNFGIIKNPHPKIKIELPKDFCFEEFIVKTGIGELKIRNLATDVFKLNCGVGETGIDDIIVKKSADISAGVGEVKIAGSSIHNMMAKAGVGEFDFAGKLTGKSIVQSGIGEAKLRVDGNSDDYNVDCSAGLGEININGEKYPVFKSSYKTTDSEKPNSLILKSGIGEISVDFKN